MEFLELAKNRYSCRKYLDKNIEEEKLLKVLEAGRVAPSAKNYQPWYFVVINEQEKLNEIKSCYQRKWIQAAPVIIVILGDHMKSWYRGDGKDHCNIDVSIAIDHMTLAATSLQLATCWVCKFDAIKVSEMLNLPEGIEPVALLPIGYPADETNPERHETLRKPKEEIIFWNQYNK